MLNLNTTNRITFEVNVQGTASPPVVRCVLGESPAMSFQATKLVEDTYEVLIDVPPSIKEGTHPFKVEVLLNGKLFTPINTTIQVSGAAQDAALPALKSTDTVFPAIQPAAEPAQIPTPEEVKPAAVEMPKPKGSLFASVTKNEALAVPAPAKRPLFTAAAKPAPAKPVPLAVVETVEVLKKTPAPAMNKLEKLIKQPVQLLKKKMPVPPAKAKTVQFSMADVANEAHELYDTKAPAATTRRVAEQVKTIPMTVVKGEIIYR